MGETELSVKEGDICIELDPDAGNGWVEVCMFNDHSTGGYIPSGYVEPYE